MLTFGETHARATDPETSKAAARRASRFSASQAGRILLALQQHGPSSAKDLSPILGLTMEQIDRRLPDLKDEGLARVVLLSDGAELVREKCRVWEAVRP
jgi:predicted ArsR family transcriptional regulator